MAIRNIITDDEKALRKRSREVTEFNARLHELLDDMRETLLLSNGVGLAAPQVGVLRRVVLVLDTNKDAEADDQIIELINPEIAAQSGEQEGQEGCLSIPGVYGIVKRPQLVKVKAQDRFGKTFEAWGEGLTARAFCHEIDHLKGVLYTDHAIRFLTREEIEAMNTVDEESED